MSQIETAVGIPVAVPVSSASPADGAYPKKPSLYPDVQQSAPAKTVPPTKLTGFPRGLCNELERSSREFASRFWVVDNSGSMQANDGQRMVLREDGRMVSVRSTRWEELGDTVLRIGDTATKLHCRTDFHLLSPIKGTAVPRQYLTLEAGWTSSLGVAGLKCAGESATMNELKEVMAGTPYWGTPLTEAVETIRAQIAPEAARLQAKGQRVLVVIATDGMPNCPQSFIEAMRQLQRLPVLIIVRLCTSDDSIVNYWSSIDKCLERPLDALDDLVGEAKEVRRYNPWLVYGQPLHTAREFGLHHHLFDLLDERRLLPSQVKQLCELILGCTLPEPEVDPPAFYAALSAALADAGNVHDPLAHPSSSPVPWVNIDKLKQHVNPTCAGSPLGQLCLGLGQLCLGLGGVVNTAGNTRYD